MRIGWTLEQLHTFVAVVAAGSFTRAAEELLLSQPAVSVQMRMLERAVGAQLLERRPRRLLLTDAGRVLHQYALKMTRLEDEFRAQLADVAALGGGSLRVGAGATPSIFRLAPVFAGYYSRWPQVDLKVQIGRTSELLEDVRRDNLDLAIVSSQPDDELFDCTPIYSERCVAAVAAGHHLAGRKNADITEVAACPMVLLPSESGFRRYLASALSGKGVRLNPAMELASLEAIKEVVRTGTLISIVPETAMSNESVESGLVSVAIDGADLVRTTVAVRRSDKYVSRAMQAFYDLLLA